MYIKASRLQKKPKKHKYKPLLLRSVRPSLLIGPQQRGFLPDLLLLNTLNGPQPRDKAFGQATAHILETIRGAENPSRNPGSEDHAGEFVAEMVAVVGEHVVASTRVLFGEIVDYLL